MNDTQPGTPSVSTFLDALLLSNSTRVIPETLANAIPETTPDNLDMLPQSSAFTFPTLRLPQIAPTEVIAVRQRSQPSPSSSIPVTSLPPVAFTATDTPVEVQLDFPPSVPVPDEAHTALAGSQTLHQDDTSTAFRDHQYQERVSELGNITRIPRSMNRDTQPTIIDVLIACSTLILIGFCILMLLYIVGL